MHIRPLLLPKGTGSPAKGKATEQGHDSGKHEGRNNSFCLTVGVQLVRPLRSLVCESAGTKHQAWLLNHSTHPQQSTSWQCMLTNQHHHDGKWGFLRFCCAVLFCVGSNCAYSGTTGGR